MSGKILIIVAIAITAYILVPGFAGIIARFRVKRLAVRLAAGTGDEATIEGVERNTITLAFPDGRERLSLDPRETRFFIFDREPGPEKLSWKTVRLIQSGTRITYLAGKNGLKRGVCVFHSGNGAIAADARELLAKGSWIPETGPLPIKAFSVATGIFLEFLMLIEALGQDGAAIVAIAALVGIFGKALPYLPPAFFSRSPEQKKNRQRGATGFIFIALGTALNISVLFLFILNVGIVLP